MLFASELHTVMCEKAVMTCKRSSRGDLRYIIIQSEAWIGLDWMIASTAAETGRDDEVQLWQLCGPIGKLHYIVVYSEDPSTSPAVQGSWRRKLRAHRANAQAR
jgi:hypothetical protein